MKNKYISLQNLSKSFTEGAKTNQILNKVNADIAEGEIIILLGKSGSGKTTLLNLLSGIDLPDSGGIIYKDTDITQLNEHDRTIFRRNNVGFVFQFFNLLPTLNVFENLLLPLQLSNKINKESNQLVMELLDSVGLTHKKMSFPDTLSGGEQQRVAIARALIHDPAIVLADEPTGNLDYETSNIIINMLDTLVRRYNKTMFMATHSREVIGMADKIITVRDGDLIIEKGRYND